MYASRLTWGEISWFVYWRISQTAWARTQRAGFLNHKVSRGWHVVAYCKKRAHSIFGTPRGGRGDTARQFVHRP